MARDTYTTKFTTEGFNQTIRDLQAIAKGTDELKKQWEGIQKSSTAYSGYAPSPRVLQPQDLVKSVQQIKAEDIAPKNPIKLIFDKSGLKSLEEDFKATVKRFTEPIKLSFDLSALAKVGLQIGVQSLSTGSFNIKDSFMAIANATIKIDGKNLGDYSAPVVKTLEKGFSQLIKENQKSNSPLARITTGFLEGIGRGVTGTYTARQTNKFLDNSPALEDPMGAIKTANKALASLKRAFEFINDPLKAAAKYGEDIEDMAKETNADLREAFAFLRNRKQQQVGDSVRKARQAARTADLNLSQKDIDGINDSPSINIVAGGLSQAGGEDSAKTARGMGILFKKLGVKDSAVIPSANPFSDRLPVKLPDQLQGKSFTEATEKVVTMGRNYAQAVFENTILGYNPDAIAMAGKAIAYRKQFPDKPINLTGYSGGGNIASEALAILKQAGITNIKGLGVGSPQSGILFDQDKDYTNMVGTDDPIRFPTLDLLGNSARNKDVAGGKNHELREYIRNKDFQKEFISYFQETNDKNEEKINPIPKPDSNIDPIVAFKNINNKLKGSDGLGKKFQDAIAKGDNKLAQELGDRIIKATDAAYGLFDKIPEANRDKSLKGVKGSMEARRAATQFDLAGLPPSIGQNVSAGFDLGADGKKQGKKLGKEIIDGTEDELGIKSPSRVFQRIGKFVVEGLENGLEGFEGTLDEKKSFLERYVKSVIELVYDFKKVVGEANTPAQELRKLFQDIGSSAKDPTKSTLKKVGKSFPDVAIKKGLGEVGGQYDPNKNQITVSENNLEDFASVLTHEYTHALQSAFGKNRDQPLFNVIGKTGKPLIKHKDIKASAERSVKNLEARIPAHMLSEFKKVFRKEELLAEKEAYANQYVDSDRVDRGFFKADAQSKVPLYKAVKAKFRESNTKGSFKDFLNFEGFDGIDALAKKLGIDINSGFESAIKGKKQGKKFGKEVIDGAKNELGISSPSKVFEQIGKWVTEGFNNGVEGAGDLPKTFVEWVDKIRNAINKLPEGAKQGLGIFKQLFTGFLVGQGIQGAIGWIKQLRDAASEVTLRFEQMEKAFNFSTSESSIGRLEALRQQTQQRGTDFETALQGQTQLNFATKGTALEGSVSDSIFNAVADTSAVRGFDKDQQKALFDTFTTLSDRSVITFKELSSTINALPGGLQIAARALGVTDIQLKKMAESGELITTDFLPRFIAQLNAENAVGLVGASSTAQASVARLSNSTTEFLNLFGKAKQPFETALFNTAAFAIDTLNDSILGIIKTASLFGVANFLVSFGLIGKVTSLIVGLYTSIFTTSTALGGATVASGFFQIALAKLGATVQAIGGFFSGFFGTLLKQLAAAYIATEVWTKVFETLDTSGESFASLTNQIQKDLDKVDEKFIESKQNIDDWRDSLIKALRGDGGSASNTFLNPRAEQDAKRLNELLKKAGIPQFLSDRGIATGAELRQTIFEGKREQALSQSDLFRNDASAIPALVKKQQVLETELNLERQRRTQILPGDRLGLDESVAKEKALLQQYEEISKDISARRTNLDQSLAALKQLEKAATDEISRNLLKTGIGLLENAISSTSKLLSETATGLAGVTQTVNNLQGAIDALNRKTEAKKVQDSIDITNEGLGNRTDSSKVNLSNSSALEQLKAEIASGEGGYNSVNRGKAGDTPGGAFSLYGKNLTEMTIAQVLSKQRNDLFAVGKYQFIPQTLKEAVNYTGIGGGELFNEKNQERLFQYLISPAKRPRLAAFLSGKSKNINSAVTDLSQEFASIPGNDGRGAYDNDSAGNLASGGLARVEKIKKLLRAISVSPSQSTAQQSTAAITRRQEESALVSDQERSLASQSQISEARKKIDSFPFAKYTLDKLGINPDDVGQDLTTKKGNPLFDGLIKSIEDYRKLLDDSRNTQKGVLDAQVRQRDAIIQDTESLIKQANDSDLVKAQGKLKIGIATYDQLLAKTQDTITRQYIESSKEGFQNAGQFAIDRTANQQKFEAANRALAVPGIDKNLELAQIKEEEQQILINYNLIESIRKSKLAILKIDNNTNLANERREQSQRLSVETQKLEDDKALRDFDNAVRDAKTIYNPDRVAADRKYLEETIRLNQEELRLKIAIANAQEKLTQVKLKGLTTGIDEQKNIDSLIKQLDFVKEQVKDADINKAIATRGANINQLIKQLRGQNTLGNLRGEISDELANRQERGGGDLFGANRLRIATATLRIQSETNLKVAEYNRLISSPKALSESDYESVEQVMALRDATIELSEIKIDNLKQQFKDLGTTIADTANTAFGNFFDEIFQGTKSIGDAFNNMAVSILKSLAKIASDGFFSNLKNLLGLGGSPDAGFSIQNLFNGGASAAPSFDPLGAIDGVSFDTAIPEGLSFSEGGFTGQGGKFDPAGIVHKGEVVFSQEDVSSLGLNFLQGLRNSGRPKMPDLRTSSNSNADNQSRNVSVINNYTIPNSDSLRKTSSQLAIEQAEANRRAMKYN